MELSSLTAVSPVDGRYHAKTESLDRFFSEFALIKYRVKVEVEYFIFLSEIPLPQLADFPADMRPRLRDIVENFSLEDARVVKNIERTTNHDVKAVEYFLKERFEALGLQRWMEFIHFGLTSQDINNTSFPMMIADAMREVYRPLLERLTARLEGLADEWKEIPMLARTHGQPATPTRLGKEFGVFAYRLRRQIELLDTTPVSGKFGGATGNMNAHRAAYPTLDWPALADRFASERLGIVRERLTTQISNYDNLAALFDAMARINTIVLDLDRDVWTYISMDYFKQRIKAGEVGSSAMPHKVNPIDFENSEGNLGVANAIFAHLASKLPVSRLQRDLTDSTVLRNVGVPVAHTVIAFESTLKGLDKLVLNEERIRTDLADHWAVLAEAVQTILRREGYDHPYEALKALTRTNSAVTEESIRGFIDGLNVSEDVKAELYALTPLNYTGF